MKPKNSERFAFLLPRTELLIISLSPSCKYELAKHLDHNFKKFKNADSVHVCPCWLSGGWAGRADLFLTAHNTENVVLVGPREPAPRRSLLSRVEGLDWGARGSLALTWASVRMT